MFFRHKHICVFLLHFRCLPSLFISLLFVYLIVFIGSNPLIRALVFSTPDNKWMFLPPGSGQQLQAQTFHYIDGTARTPTRKTQLGKRKHFSRKNICNCTPILSQKGNLSYFWGGISDDSDSVNNLNMILIIIIIIIVSLLIGWRQINESILMLSMFLQWWRGSTEQCPELG